MARPQYETKSDLDAEHLVAVKISEHLGADYIKLPKNSRADCLFHKDGAVKAIVEIKRRSNTRSKYETYMLGRGKYDALLGWSKRGFNTALFVQWADDLAYIKIPAPYTEGTGGRFDRNDSMDVESVVLIETSRFKTIIRQAE